MKDLIKQRPMTDINEVFKELKAFGLSPIKTRTLHSTGSAFYQLKKRDGTIYPESRGKAQDVGERTILKAYDKYGVFGVMFIFGLNG